MNLATHTYKNDKGETLRVDGGFDRILGYAFMGVFREGADEPEYSNLSEANPFAIKDFSYFTALASKQFGLDVRDMEKAVTLYKDNMNSSLEEYRALLTQNGLEKFAKTCWA